MNNMKKYSKLCIETRNERKEETKSIAMNKELGGTFMRFVVRKIHPKQHGEKLFPFGPKCKMIVVVTQRNFVQTK